MHSTIVESHSHVFFTEAKSQTIRRMQGSLETWDKQLEEIVQKKTHNGRHQHCMMHKLLSVTLVYMYLDSVTRSEIEKRNHQLEELTGQYNRECETKEQTEEERDKLTLELVCN